MNEDAIYAARIELIDFCIECLHDTPDEAFVERLLSGGYELPADSVNDRLDRGFDHLEAFVEANRDRDSAEVTEELAVEYTRVFVGPRPPVLAHETYYREDTEFIGEGLAEVTASYAAAGWNAPADYGEEDDFVAVELAFLRNLVGRQRAGKEETFGFERVFLDEHLLQWVDEFVADVEDETDEPFYLAAANVLAGLVELEDELVASQMA
jgi:TorA maturation chaperone TorD